MIWLAFGLVRQNQYLVWQIQHPNEIYEILPFVNSLLMFITAFYLISVCLDNVLEKQVSKRVLTGVFPNKVLIAALQVSSILGLLSGVLIGITQVESWIHAKHALPIERQRVENKRIAELQEREKRLQQLISQHNRTVKEIEQLPGSERRQKTLEKLNSIFQSTTNSIGKSSNLPQISPSILPNPLAELEGQASKGALLGRLSIAILVFWSFADLLVRSWKEQQFVFFKTAEEEESEKQRALIIEEREQKEKQNAVPTGAGVSVISTGVAMLIPYHYVAADVDFPEAGFFMIAMALSQLPSWVATLRNWGKARVLDTVVIAFTILAIVGNIALLSIGPAPLILKGLVSGLGLSSLAWIALLKNKLRAQKELS